MCAEARTRRAGAAALREVVMPFGDLQQAAESYARDGFLSPVEILSDEQAAGHRARLDEAESRIGPLHYRGKVHTILRSPFELATLPRVLDVVEALIGPDILLHNVTYIVKEAGARSHVSWHQDLTYWGFDGDAQVSMWLALTPATRESGCMRMVPGSHLAGRRDHSPTDDSDNVLFQGQTVEGETEETAVLCPLRPGEASFHHGWTLHASPPNRSPHRRIGLNVQYLAPHMRQTKNDLDSALLVRGEDRYRHFQPDLPAETDLDPAAIERQRELDRRYQAVAGTG
jgi:ectoine hydroxylase-related dioxygenase (phytanoyl-CoA dioxygenase family)